MIKRNFILILLTATIGVAILNASSSIEDTTVISDINNGITIDSLKKIESLSVNSFEGEFVVLNLWASWCIPCQNEVEELKKISEKNNFSVIGVLVDDSPSNGEDFISKYKISYENILEEQESDLILSQFSWSGIPTTLVLDKNLTILHTLNGEVTAQEIFDLTK
tara:strand:+ start:22 stop:516 length:495 start_codon:yes stop_codon:yes gene_type:complete